jgi:hypothetical protein
MATSGSSEALKALQAFCENFGVTAYGPLLSRDDTGYVAGTPA